MQNRTLSSRSKIPSRYQRVTMCRFHSLLPTEFCRGSPSKILLQLLPSQLMLTRYIFCCYFLVTTILAVHTSGKFSTPHYLTRRINIHLPAATCTPDMNLSESRRGKINAITWVFTGITIATSYDYSLFHDIFAELHSLVQLNLRYAAFLQNLGDESFFSLLSV
jgi:hypothetical protein